jgi:hypothetical protein
MKQFDSKEAVRRNALDGDHDAICVHLLNQGIDPDIVGHVRKLRKRRSSVEANFENRVRAIIHYRKRGLEKVTKSERIAEMLDLFPLPINVIEHLASGHGYSKEHLEATARMQAESDSSH